MFAFLAGSTPYVVVGQPQERSPPGQSVRSDVNSTYCDFANHMGFAGAAGQALQGPRPGLGGTPHWSTPRGFLQEVRNRVFYSLPRPDE